jgi:hypothetical protein
MKQFCLSLVIGVLAIWSIPAMAADPLISLKGEKRPLLLFAKSRSFAPLDKQLDLLRSYRPDLKDRDMVVLSTTGNQETSSAIGYVSLNRGTARQLRRQYGPDAQGLTVVLVGKDGTEKARWHKLVEPQVIFDLIDSMPMRQDEINSQVETQ